MKQSIRHGRGLEDIYLNRSKQKMFIIFIIYITHYSLTFLVLKQMQEREMNGWKIELYSS